MHGKLQQRQTAKGRFGQALAFSVKEDVVLLPDSQHFNVTGPLTVAAQLKIVSPDLHQHVFAGNDLFVLWLTTRNQYRFADTLGQGFTTMGKVDEVTEGEWHSVVAVLSTGKGDTLNKDNIKIFVDGTELQGRHEKVWSPTKLADANACVIGGTRTGSEKHQDLQFEGIIDELLIFSRALSTDEIKAYSNHH